MTAPPPQDATHTLSQHSCISTRNADRIGPLVPCLCALNWKRLKIAGIEGAVLNWKFTSIYLWCLPLGATPSSCPLFTGPSITLVQKHYPVSWEKIYFTVHFINKATLERISSEASKQAVLLTTAVSYSSTVSKVSNCLPTSECWCCRSRSNSHSDCLAALTKLKSY